jgi:hypothetical protein
MTGQSRARDQWAYAGILAVAVAAAVLSFDSLAGLAELSGVAGRLARFRLSWLLPVSVDAYAVTSTRVWLRTARTSRTAAYARRNAFGAIVLSVAGNATFHGLTAAGVGTLAQVRWGWLLVVAVSAVPPVMLGLVAHLHALVSAEQRAAEARSPRRPAADPVPAPAELRPVPMPRSRGNGNGTAEAVMREHWERERTAGRTPTGAELDRVAGTKPGYGRKVRRTLLAEIPQTEVTA